MKSNLRTRSPHTRTALMRISLLVASSFSALNAGAQTLHLLTEDGKLSSVAVASATAPTTPVTITGVTAGETLVAIDVRPQNQQLYALGVNATTEKATLYVIEPTTGFANPVGTASQIALTTNGVINVDFPDPATVKWDIDFNPAVDRLRVVAGSLNFRVNPNTGAAVDGDNGGAVVAGTNPDGTINPLVAPISSANAVAYTNNQPNNGNITTLYVLDDVNNTLTIQNPANSGTQTLSQAVTLAGNPLNISKTSFDIAPGINAAASNTAVASGTGYIVAKVAGSTSGVYSLNLLNAQATFLGDTGLAIRGAAIRTQLGAAIAYSPSSTSLVRFDPATPGTNTTQAITGLTVGETLVGIDSRPQTGQLYGLGINATTNTGTLYLIDPQGGALTSVGAAGSIALTDSDTAVIDFPDTATVGYGFDFNPTVDRIRVIAGNGVNFRLNPDTGAPVDGDTVSIGINPDGPQNGATISSSSAAYTNNVAQSLTGGVTTLYTLDATTGKLFIQNPPNAGTQTLGLSVTLGGSPLAFTGIGGFDIPSSVSVAASNTAAVGEGWFTATVGGVTGLYRINLANGKATSIGAIGAGASAMSGLALLSSAADLVVENPANTVVADNASSVNFGSAFIGGTPVNATVTLRNIGSQPLTYSTSFDTGTSFSASTNGSGTIAGTSTTVITLSFIPTANGPLNDTLHILSNDPDVASFEIALTGIGYTQQSDDAVFSSNGPTRLNPLANDTLPGDLTITSVSDPSITIEGRTLIIPSGYVGDFTYTVSNGTDIGQATVTVNAGDATVSPKTYNGVLIDSSGNVVGRAKAALTSAGKTSVTLITEGGNGAGKVVFPIGTTVVTTSTNLGPVTIDRNPDGQTGVLAVDLALNGGGNLTGVLHAEKASTTPVVYHMEMASIDSTLAGGGYIVASVTKNATMRLLGVLPDGNSFTATSVLTDNSAVSVFTLLPGIKSSGTLGGDLTLGDLVATDIIGELAWKKPSGGSKGTELQGVDTIVKVNGSLFDRTVPLYSGIANLELAGGNLLADEISGQLIDNGVPVGFPIGSLLSWKANTNLGTFQFTATVPTLPRRVAGRGIYLQKSNRAVGYFPGSTKGGRVIVSP